MSHFTVLVVGDDHDHQLAPFHEFECTGLDDEFVRDLDQTDEVLAQIARQAADGAEDPLKAGLEWFGLDDRTVSDESEIDRSDTHKYGYAILRDGKLVKAVRRSNPDKKWDWYQVGGRWTGFFLLKPGARGELGSPGLMTQPAGAGRADRARKDAIDFAAMRDRAGEAAGARWDTIRATTGGQTWESWVSMRGRMMAAGEAIDAIRAAYNGQEAIKALSEAGLMPFFGTSDDMLAPREAVVQQARDSAICTYAAVHERRWLARGDMGWFGMSGNEAPAGEWERQFNALIDSLPGDAVLTIIDCHI